MRGDTPEQAEANAALMAAAPELLTYLRRLLAAGAQTQGIDGYCHYCPAYLIAEEPHAADCPYAAAVAFLDSLLSTTATPTGGPVVPDPSPAPAPAPEAT